LLFRRSSLLTDLYRALRGLLKAKYFAASVVLTLGVGTGSATAVFFLIRSASLRYPDSVQSNIIAGLTLPLMMGVNLVGLLLSHGFARRRDIAVRIALGAPYGTILRQLLAECACLGLAGGVAGLIIAEWIVDLFVATPPDSNPTPLDFATNSTTVGLALGMSMLIAISVGLAAFRLSRSEIHAGLKRDPATIGTRRGRLPRILVAAQFALTFILLTTASTQRPTESLGPSAAPFMMVLSVMGLLLAGVGLNSLVAFSAGQRTREIGVRVALGAPQLDVVSFVARPGIWLSGLGLAIGIVGSIVLRLFMRSQGSRIVGVATLDPASYLRATMALAVVALVATYRPARSASRIDLTAALRDE
jgi:ABC-type antimicrobial peptide transport system permease subunit